MAYQAVHDNIGVHVLKSLAHYLKKTLNVLYVHDIHLESTLKAVQSHTGRGSDNMVLD